MKYWKVLNENGQAIGQVIAYTYQQALKKAKQEYSRASDVEED